MPSYMGIFKRRYICSNLQVMLLRGRIKSVVSKRQSMISTKVHGRGLRSLALPSPVLVFTSVAQITVFVRHIKSDIVVLTVYVDDILLTDSDLAVLLETKEYLKGHFVTKDMGKPKYFQKIEVAHKNIVYFFLNESML